MGNHFAASQNGTFLTRFLLFFSEIKEKSTPFGVDLVADDTRLEFQIQLVISC